MTPRKVAASAGIKAERLDNSAKERAMHSGRRRVLDIGDYFPAGPSKKRRTKASKAGYDQIEDRRSFPRPPTRGR